MNAITITRSHTFTTVAFNGRTETFTQHNTKGVGHYEAAERTASGLWCSNDFLPTIVRTSNYR